eukprot:Hpha_TRINITY_DN15321_c1_g16::TRINITY_DN15321_c1_g16_i1::g.89691::m.89691
MPKGRRGSSTIAPVHHPEWLKASETTSPRRRDDAHTGRSHHKHNEESAGHLNHNHYWTGQPTSPSWRSKVNDTTDYKNPRGKVAQSRIHETTHHRDPAKDRFKMGESKINSMSGSTAEFEHKGKVTPGSSRVNRGSMHPSRMEGPESYKPHPSRFHPTHHSGGVKGAMDHYAPPPPSQPRSPRVGSTPLRARGPVRYVEDFTTNAQERRDLP